MKLVDKILNEGGNYFTLYHGTCKENAVSLLQNGWKKGFASGGNMGQGKYLYVSSDPEDALWFAQEKGCNCVLKIKNVSADSLIPDPEDEAGYTLNDLFKRINTTNFPAKFAVVKPLPKENFELIKNS